jgi:hypothetical protein
MSKTLDGDFINNSERNLETGRYLRNGHGNTEFMNVCMHICMYVLCMYVCIDGWMEFTVNILNVVHCVTVNITTNYWTLNYWHGHLAKAPKKVYHHHHYQCQPITLHPIHLKKKAMTFSFKSNPLHPPTSYQAYVYTLKRYPRFQLRLYKFL